MPSHVDEVIRRFFAAYAEYQRLGGLPELGESSISVADYSALEARLHVRLPLSFKIWHSSYSFAEASIGGLQLPAAPIEHPLSRLESAILETGISGEAVPMRILPFAWSEDTGQFLCFDARQERDGSEWPIVGLNHDLPFRGALASSNGRYVAESFLDLIDELVDTLEELTKWASRLR